MNITNLTAEIESFVRTADTDKETIKSKEVEASDLKIEENNIEHKENEKSKTSRQSPESNDYYPQDENCDDITIEKLQNLGSTDVNSNERCKKSPVKILIRAPTDEETILVIDEEPAAEYKEDENDAKDTEQEIMIVEQEIKEFTDTKERREDQVSQKDIPQDEKETSQTENGINGSNRIETTETVKIIQDTEESTTPTSSAVEFILENENMTDSSAVTTLLKITESNENLSKIEPETSVPIEVNKEIEVKTEEIHREKPKNAVVNEANRSSFRFEVRSVPLKLNSPQLRKKSDDGKKREPPTPPQRRRSVKEIIESINKCQSLLKVNQDPKTDKTEKDKMNNDLYQASSSSMKTFKGKSSFVDRNVNDTVEKQYENKKMFSDITEVNNNAKSEDMSNIPLFVEKFNEFNNNNPNSIFEKCVIRDNKTSNDEKVSNVEWNPVPKPRRHRNSTQGSIN